ncbi:MAG: class I SAM-dependent methyltransferase [Panacagrimonas sp.]
MPPRSAEILSGDEPTPGGDSRGFSLLVDPLSGQLGLCALHRPDWKPVCIDWFGAEMRSRIRAGRRQLLARAVGLHRHPGAAVLDATGGLGRDAFTLAALGANVMLVERQPLVVELLRDAQQRARQAEDSRVREAADRLRIIGSDALDVGADQGPFDAVYLDPMYPGDGKSALPQKQMQLLRELSGDDLDASELLAHARRLAWRVAVKRPLKAEWLGGAKPDAVLEGTQARFDLYLRPQT